MGGPGAGPPWGVGKTMTRPSVLFHFHFEPRIRIDFSLLFFFSTHHGHNFSDDGRLIQIFQLVLVSHLRQLSLVGLTGGLDVRFPAANITIAAAVLRHHYLLLAPQLLGAAGDGRGGGLVEDDEAVVADSDGGEEVLLGHGRRFGRAAVAEEQATVAAMVLAVRDPEMPLTSVKKSGKISRETLALNCALKFLCVASSKTKILHKAAT